MIKFLKHSEIDKAQWDRCIDQSDQAIVYAKAWYLDLVSPGWNALVEDNYHAVFPLTWRRKWSLNYLFQPAFTQQLGLFSAEKSSEDKLKEFLLAIPSSYKLIEIQLNTANLCEILPIGFKKIERINHILDLNVEKASLEKNFSVNTRRNIKKFEKSSNQITSQIKIDDLILLFRNNRGKDIIQLEERDYSVFKSICVEADKRGLLSLKGATDPGGKLIGACVFLHTQSGYILLFTSLSEQGKECGAMSALISSFILEHAEKKGILDFEGSMDPGIARFYKSFGSHEIVYLQIRNNRLPMWLRLVKN